MPKPHTFPILLDEVLQLDLSKLRKWDYLKPNQSRSGIITWTRNYDTSSISIKVSTFSEPYIELSYKFNGELREYRVNLVAVSSNLGVGEVLYMLCPLTKKRCRKLYMVNGYFLHREAFKGVMYSTQIRSKKERWLDENYGAYFQEEKWKEELNSKYFKKTYAGLPTKKYLRLKKNLQRAGRIDFGDIERMLIMGF